MQLYLVRHGQPLEKSADPERGMAPEGTAEVHAMAEALSHLGLSVADLWHSTRKRARQTAEILAPAFAATGKLTQRDGLSPNDDAMPVARELARRDANLAIVGHMPFQARLASALLTGSDDSAFLNFTTAAVACLDRDDDGVWWLNWMAGPNLVT